jgi:hypothetical protein
MKTILSITIICVLVSNCVHVTVARSDILYFNEIDKDKINNNKYNLGIKFSHAIWKDEYFAKDTVSDSIYGILPKYRENYYKKIGYKNIGGMTACGWNNITRLEILDTTHIQITGINYEDIKWGIYKLQIICKDTGTIPIQFYTKNDIFKSNLIISKDTVLLEKTIKNEFERKKRFLPFLWLAHLWPF